MQGIEDMDFRFYHLEYNPFVTQSSDHLFWNSIHQRVWDRLLERIDKRQGIIGLLGEPGLGKTTLLQAYQSSVDPKSIHVINGIDATQPPPDLLVSLAQGCGLNPPTNEPEALFSAVYQHCHAAHACGRQVVWLIDDADALSVKDLEHVHELFARLHREDEPMLQIVLSGRPVLQQRCQHPNLYLFEQALPTFLTLSPLEANDRAAYIHHYLKVASTQASKIFTKGAVNVIVEHTQGIPKVINITCTDVLVAGLLAGEKPISVSTVQTILHDEAFRLSPKMRWGIVSAAGILLAAGLWSLLPETTPSAPPHTVLATTERAPTHPPQVLAPILPATTPLAKAAATAAHLMPTPQPVQAAVYKPTTPPIRPAATPLEVENKIREFRDRQALQTAIANVKTAAVDRDQRRADTATFVNASINRERGNTTPDLSQRPKLKGTPPTALAPQLSRPNTPESKASEVITRSVTPPPQSAGKRAALVASASARLLCAMPRTGGRRGSDIVLLGHSRHPVHRLIEDGSQNMSPVLSPDGAHLAYTSYRDGTPNIYLRDLASGQETRVTTGARLALPGSWSPNGRYLSLSQSINGNNDIYIYDVVQQRLRRLTQHKGIDVSPSFAPDSQRLVFSSDRTGSPQLYITDITGLPPVRLTRSGAYNTSPSWSPQDDTVAFIGRSQKRALDLYTIKPDGSQRQQLTKGQRFHTPPAWLPDGRTLMGMSLRGAVWERHLMQLDPNQSAPTLPKPESLCLAPQWVAYRAP